MSLRQKATRQRRDGIASDVYRAICDMVHMNKTFPDDPQLLRPAGRKARAVSFAREAGKKDSRMRKHHQGLEGRIVQVIDGPFTGFRGEVKEVDEQTVKVDVQAFGRITPMDLALGQIELVPENSN